MTRTSALQPADADRLRTIAAQFPEIRESAQLLLDGPPPEPEPDHGFPMVDRCGCGWTDDTAPVLFHRRGADQCRADQ